MLSSDAVDLLRVYRIKENTRKRIVKIQEEEQDESSCIFLFLFPVSIFLLHLAQCVDIIPGVYMHHFCPGISECGDKSFVN